MDNKVIMVKCPNCSCVQAVYIDFTLPFEPYVYHCLICKEVVSKYGINGRRLRELFNEKSDVKKQWKLNDKGKRIFVEYFVEMPIPPTKAQAIEIGQQILDAMNKEIKQGELFQ